MSELVKSRRVDAQVAMAIRRGLDPDDWEHLVYLLLKGEPLPMEYCEHRLTDNWQGWWECHLAADLLVVYRHHPGKVVVVAVGTHAELFPHRKR